MQQMLRQVQKMQQQMAEAQEQLKHEEVEASAGGGMVKVKVSGDLVVKSVTIAPDAIDPDDPELLQDMVLAATNEALRSAQELARRGRQEAAFDLVRRRWSSWRGRAVEPLVRQSLELAAPALPWPEVNAVGGWWNRQFNPEIDLVGADQAPIARRIQFAGSIKWLETHFDDRDLADLRRTAAQVPGFTYGKTGLVVVTRTGTAPNLDLGKADLVWHPDDILSA